MVVRAHRSVLSGFSIALALFCSAVFATANADSVPSYVKEACSIGDGTVLGQNTASKFAHLPGVYTGDWDGQLDSTLIIVDVDDNGRAESFYAYGTYSGWNIHQPGCRGVFGEVSGDSITYKGRRTITYRVNSPNELRGTYDFGSGFSRGTFSKLTSHPWQGK